MNSFNYIVNIIHNHATMPNGWKKNAAYLNTEKYTHKEYVEEKNKFRKWKKEYGIHNRCYGFYCGKEHENKMKTDKESCIKLRSRRSNEIWGLSSYGHYYYIGKDFDETLSFSGIKPGGVLRTSNKDPIYNYIFKFVNKEKINANDKNTRYGGHIYTKWLNREFKDMDKLRKKKNNERITDHAKVKKKKQISQKYSEKNCSVCLNRNWEHRMKAIKCSSKQKNKNYICMTCVEKLKDHWGDANCPLCRSHLIATTPIQEYCAKYL